MAFTEEQEKAILEFVTKANAGQSDAEKAAAAEKAKADAANNKVLVPESKTLAQAAKEEIESEKAKKSNLEQIQSSVKFNMGVKEFVEKNKSLLPDEAAKILSTAETKQFADDIEKANIVRKSLIDSFLSQKENMDSLTVSMVSRANEYNKLAEGEKEKRSSEFWDLVEIGTALKAGVRKAEALNKVNGVTAGDGSRNIIQSKILAKAKEKFNIKK